MAVHKFKQKELTKSRKHVKRFCLQSVSLRILFLLFIVSHNGVTRRRTVAPVKDATKLNI